MLAGTRSRRHAAGALYGLAVGDALGTTLEFQELSAPAFPALAAGPHVSVIGGGPFDVEPGQVTDDTQMACALFRSLLDNGAFSADDVAARYVAWREVAFDIGGQTSAALAAVAGGAGPAASGRAVWEHGGRRPAGNGSLMRTAPIAVFFASDDEARRRASMQESAITHFDPRCQLACAAFNAALATAVRGAASSVDAVFDAAKAELSAAAEHLLAAHPDLETEVAHAAEDLASDLRASRLDDPQLYSDTLHLHKMQGFVRVAFRLAFWELVHAPSYEAAVIDAVNRGGDADTNGAIVGALLGAYYGQDSIPTAWLECVLGALPEAAGKPLTSDYHPRQFRAGLERIYGA